MIVITGAAGFIGSCMVGYLNDKGFYDLLLSDDFSREDRKLNFINKKYSHLIDRSVLLHRLQEQPEKIQAVIHLGARTDTYETDRNIFNQLNLHYSQELWKWCTEEQVPFLYASSAATYGDGSEGFSDDNDLERLSKLKPLNEYARSKQEFDLWALSQTEKPYFWAGFKFFNVYGPNEYHKNKMASVIWHFFSQIQNLGKVNLFKSYHPNYMDGEQKRDFIYVQDVVEVLFHFLTIREHSGLYNLGTGKAETYNYLAECMFNTLKKPKKIEYVDLDDSHRPRYQYFTEADIRRLRASGYKKEFTCLSSGIPDYLINYLIPQKYR